MLETDTHPSPNRISSRPSATKQRLLIFAAVVIAGAGTTFGQLAGTNPLVRFNTDDGPMDTVLRQDVAPNTVANFLRYVKRGDYDNSFFHRSIQGFIIQGGGFKWVNGQAVAIAQDPPVANEFHLS